MFSPLVTVVWRLPTAAGCAFRHCPLLRPAFKKTAPFCTNRLIRYHDELQIRYESVSNSTQICIENDHTGNEKVQIRDDFFDVCDRFVTQITNS